MFINIATKSTRKLKPPKKLFDKEGIIFMNEAKTLDNAQEILYYLFHI